MPEFTYKAKKGPSEVVNGSLEAATLDEAVEKLDRMGLFPIHLDEVTTKTAPQPAVQKAEAPPAAETSLPRPEAPRSAGLPLFSRVKSSEITMFGRQLASLIKS